MIDLKTETVMSLTEATKHLPTRRGKKPHVSTLYRWAQRGVRGEVLETIQVGGVLCTSLEALQRFCDGLTKPQPTPAGRASAERRRAIDRADKQLEKMGL